MRHLGKLETDRLKDNVRNQSSGVGSQNVN